MNTSWSKVGCRVAIVDMLHSPARTRECASWLIGRQGTVVSALRNNTLALVRLDGDDYDMPGGVRRWTIHWDDLEVREDGVEPKKLPRDHRLGLSGAARAAVHHAVPADRKTSLCGVTVRPLTVLGWSISFTPTATGACPTCVRMLDQPKQQTSAHDS